MANTSKSELSIGSKGAPYTARPGMQGGKNDMSGGMRSDMQNEVQNEVQNDIQNSIWGDPNTQFQNTLPNRPMTPPSNMPMLPMQDNTLGMGDSAAQMSENRMLANDDVPETLTNPIYTPAFLSQFIGRLMRVEFLIGDQITDRVGRLSKVGASYIVLQSIEPNSSILCDLYSIKFVTIVRDATAASLFASPF